MIGSSLFADLPAQDHEELKVDMQPAFDDEIPEKLEPEWKKEELKMVDSSSDSSGRTNLTRQ